MSVTATLAVIAAESPRPIDLPLHLETWQAAGSDTGEAGGGTLTFPIQAEPGSATGEWYYAITMCRIWSTAVSDIHGGLTGGDWPEFGTVTRWASEATGVVVSSFQLVDLVTVDRPVYLGRLQPGTPGGLSIVFETNTDAAGYHYVLRGYRSRKPFMIPLTFSK